MSNARFWIYHNEDMVKVTLRPGESLVFHYGGPTDEGYSYTTETYEHLDDFVYRTIDTTASDCDGRLDQHSVYRCRITDFPNWEREHASQRDYSAEAMGY